MTPTRYISIAIGSERQVLGAESLEKQEGKCRHLIAGPITSAPRPLAKLLRNGLISAVAGP